MSLIKLFEIVSFFKDDMECIKKGENAFNSKHVESVHYNPELKRVKAKVSENEKVYNVVITLNEKFAITNAKCSCTKGLGKKCHNKCHHMAAALFQAQINLNKTTIMCLFKAPASSTDTTVSIDELFYTRVPYKAVKRAVTDEDRDFFRSELAKLGLFTGFHCILSPEPVIAPCDFDEGLFIANLIQRCKNDGIFDVSKFQNELKLKMTTETIAKVAQQTTGQRENVLWHKIRMGRITASNFHAVTYDPPTFFERMFGEQPDLPSIKAIEWRIMNEVKALRKFTELTGFEVQQCGIFLHPSGVLGASPHGLVEENGENVIVEVKCPYDLRDASEEDILQNPGYYFRGTGEVCKDHQIYTQIQGQLALTNRQRCYLVISTNKADIIHLVKRDVAWEMKIPSIVSFYYSVFLGRLIN